MANPTVTYSFSNSTTADATQVNTNFSDILTALTDGLKDITVGTVSVTGASTLQGAVAFSGTSTVVATNGGSSTVGATTSTVILAPAGTIASYTLTLPASPAEGQVLAIVTNGNEITALTVSANTGHSIVSGAGLNRMQPGSGVLLQFRSTVWYRISGYQRVGTHSVICDTGNGYGAVNTKIRRFTNSASIGTAITYADSSNDGATFTINESGVYAMYYGDSTGGGSTGFGISLNSAALTTDIASISAATRIALTAITTGFFGSCSVVRRLAASDVIRAHGNTADGTGTTTQFSIVKIAE